MDNSIAVITPVSFGLSYLLLVVILLIMKKQKIRRTGLLVLASLRMTIQLILVGFVLQYLFTNPHPLLTTAFVALMLTFAVWQILKTRSDLNRRFRRAITFSMVFSGLLVILYFLLAVVREDIFNPRYTIPLAGMIIGNAMTGITLGIRSFLETLKDQKGRIETLTNLGIDFRDILKPMINGALETALMPTLNSMLGMGIVFLPGMMTGQILSGTVPVTAIVYQITIMMAITASVCLTVFLALTLGSRSLYNEDQQYTG